MATAKTWIWIIVGFVAVCVVGLFAIAGAGVYFVASHIDTERASSVDAMQAFDDARAAFKDQQPLFELDDNERPHMLRDPSDLPSSSVRPKELVIMAWDSDEERLIKLALPFWLLRLGGREIEINDGHGFDLNRLDLDVEELERIGPTLVFDYRDSSGERVLLWTQ
jgi:hypothetical protein